MPLALLSASSFTSVTVDETDFGEIDGNGAALLFERGAKDVEVVARHAGH